MKFDSISDDVLLRRLSELLKQSRRTESELVAHLAEVDERRLYARKAFPSMFAYTEANRGTVLPRAAYKTKAKIEELVAEVAPKPDVPPRIRKLPDPAQVRLRRSCVAKGYTAKASGAARTCPIQSPVHGERGGAQEARAAPGPHAKQGFGRHPRRSGDGEARAGGGEAVWQDESTQEDR